MSLLLLLLLGLLIELLHVGYVGQHARLSMGQRTLILGTIDKAGLHRVMRETSDVLAFEPAKVEVVASTLLSCLIVSTMLFDWARAAALARRFCSFASLLFLAEDHGISLVEVNFDWIFYVKVLVFTSHSLRVPARIEVRWSTLLLFGQGSGRRPKVTRCLHRPLAEHGTSFPHQWVHRFICQARAQPRRVLALDSIVSIPCRLRESVTITSLSHQVLSVEVCRAGSDAQALRSAAHRLIKFSIILPQVELILRLLQMPVYLHQVWRKLRSLNIINRALKLHLYFLNLLRLLFLLRLEVEIVDVLGVERLDPLRNYEALLEQLYLFILPIVHSFFAQV